ncbi:MAG: tRNA 2-selenouridine(34) synthase MnmH [Saprospiraceae bacterium]|nr:tRNA 2-selenouridine(34) synthase MnmH [Saprospiraceae bacterium]
MPAKNSSVEDILESMGERPLIDLRTPSEFRRGHIPGAVNIPLFNDEERARVGKTYKQVHPREALLEGLEYVGPKMRDIVEKAEFLADGSRVAVHCWRGGKRSASVGWLLDFAGMEVAVMEGGYKAFRHYVLDYFEKAAHQFIVLGGRTGSGKTEILSQLRDRGEQVIDLEGLARHKGSAFGGLGQGDQPSGEQFENELQAILAKFDPDRPVWIENESQGIGRVYIPETLWDKFLHAPIIQLEVPLKKRVDRLTSEYAGFDKAELREAFYKISKRLGGQHLKRALEALGRDDYSEAATIALRYYDKAYDHSLGRRTPVLAEKLVLKGSFSPPEVVNELMKISLQVD